MSDAPGADPGDEVRLASATGPLSTDQGGATRPPAGGRARIFLEYVTFGYGIHHLLKVVLFQFAVLFLDVGLLDYTTPAASTSRPPLVTLTWTVASLVFLGVLATLVRQIGRRTLTPRFHRPSHIAGSVLGYLFASGFSFLFGYVTFVLPGRGVDAPLLPAVLPSWLLVVVFATFIAIGYHAQVSVTDHPSVHDIGEVVESWLDALTWVDEAPDSLDREDAYAEFEARSGDLAELLRHARTVEGRQLAADYHAWMARFETRSMLSREVLIEGRDDDVPESERLAAEHEAFLSLRRRLAAIADRGRFV